MANDAVVDDVLTAEDHADAVDGYLECAGWLVNDHELATEEERERGYEGDHRGGPFSDDAYAHAIDAVADLVSALDNPEDVSAYLSVIDYARDGSSPAAMLGHDLWLTRNGHGAGFWDRGLGELGDRLSDAARSLGEAYAYVDADEVVQIDGYR